MPSDGTLVLCTLRYGYEIRSREEIEAPAQKKSAVSSREVAMALQLVKEMSEPFSPKKYKDTYREDLMARIRKKIKSGRTTTVEQSEEKTAEPRKTAEVIDLVSLLKRSLDKTKQPERVKRRA
jgi:DNA end-binding protein Ku